MSTVVSNTQLTDFHSHCLPKMDDGANDLKTSLAMLRSSAEQGVKRVVATPHFYIGQHSVDEFVKDRQKAYDEIKPHLTKDMPEVLLGAEVLIREGVSRHDLHPLCLQGTDILLVEMPFATPPHWLLEELESLINEQGLTLMFAHLDRYLSWYSQRSFDMLMDLPDAIMQINADAVADKRFFPSLVRHLPDTRRMVLGSDMHDMKHRPSRMEKAIKVMSKKRVGREWLQRIERMTEHLETQAEDTEGLL